MRQGPTGYMSGRSGRGEASVSMSGDLPPPDPSQRNQYEPERPYSAESPSYDRLRRVLIAVGGVAMVVFAIGLGARRAARQRDSDDRPSGVDRHRATATTEPDDHGRRDDVPADDGSAASTSAVAPDGAAPPRRDRRRRRRPPRPPATVRRPPRRPPRAADGTATATPAPDPATNARGHRPGPARRVRRRSLERRPHPEPRPQRERRVPADRVRAASSRPPSSRPRSRRSSARALRHALRHRLPRAPARRPADGADVLALAGRRGHPDDHARSTPPGCGWRAATSSPSAARRASCRRSAPSLPRSSDGGLALASRRPSGASGASAAVSPSTRPALVLLHRRRRTPRS